MPFLVLYELSVPNQQGHGAWARQSKGIVEDVSIVFVCFLLLLAWGAQSECMRRVGDLEKQIHPWNFGGVSRLPENTLLAKQ